MRPYVNTRRSSQSGAKDKYRTQQATEWDLCCTLHDVDMMAEVDGIVHHLKTNIHRLSYALVGGIEYNTRDKAHVHIALIFYHSQTRHGALATIHREHIKGEYCTPRNTAFSYTGWRLHHIKEATKYNNIHLLYEHGQLPSETLTVHQWKTCTNYGYTGPRPLVQKKIVEVVKKPKQVKPDTRKGDRHINRVALPSRCSPIILKEDNTKGTHQAKRTPVSIAKATLRLANYKQLLSDCDNPEEASRLIRIINDIQRDYFDEE